MTPGDDYRLQSQQASANLADVVFLRGLGQVRRPEAHRPVHNLETAREREKLQAKQDAKMTDLQMVRQKAVTSLQAQRSGSAIVAPSV